MNMPPAYDRLVSIASHPWGRRLLQTLGLPQPVPLRRCAGGYDSQELRGLAGVVLRLAPTPPTPTGPGLADVLATLGAQVMPGPVWSAQARPAFAVLDARGVERAEELARLRSFAQPLLRQMARQAKLLVLADALPPTEVRGVLHAGLEGLVRSLAKEVGRAGATANLLRVVPGRVAEAELGPALAYFLSARSVYVSGQCLELQGGAQQVRGAALEGQAPGLVLITGAARGLGRATAERLHDEGMPLLLVDVPAAEAALQALAQKLGAQALALDVTSPDAGSRMVAALAGRPLAAAVHNAGITRDRLLRNMKGSEWDAVVAVNLQAILGIDAALDAAGAWEPQAREVLLSSINGIAGAAGQTNYSFTKSAIRAYAQHRNASQPGLIANAIAPGFIETDMTAAMPWLMREMGRRANALSQAGLPRDVAEAVCLLAMPGAAGLRGQTLRVCGQAIVGA